MMKKYVKPALVVRAMHSRPSLCSASGGGLSATWQKSPTMSSRDFDLDDYEE